MRKILLTPVLALVGGALLSPPAQAAGTYNDGDLFLGFRSTDSSITNDFFVDIGQPDQFEGAAAGSTITIGNFNADLIAALGSGYFASTTLFSITGAVNISSLSGKDNGTTLYTTVPVAAGLFPAKNDTAESGGASTISGLGGHYTSAPRNGASTASGVIESTSTQNSYRSFQPGSGSTNSGGISFGYFNPSNENAITATGVKLEGLIATDDGSNAYGKSGAFTLGTVKVSSAGLVTFQAVPEPTALTLLTCGIAGWFGIVRRRRVLRSA